MTLEDRIERALEEALDSLSAAIAPPLLSQALRYAVFPGGSRLRPKLCLAVSKAAGDSAPELADAAAAAVELLHCASLVHDDLPCFDGASTRRGKPSTHRAFGEPVAVLAGDQLIVLAFQTVTRAAASYPSRLPAVLGALFHGVSSPFGIIAGQAWESEPRIPELLYRRAKTGALFEAAVMAGAIAAGTDPEPWRIVGQRIGEAYQVADDILDLIGDPGAMGKPIGQDEALGRPNAATNLGIGRSTRLLERLLRDARDAIPSSPHRDEVRAWVAEVGDRLLCHTRRVELQAAVG